MTYQQSGLFILLGLLFVMLVWGRIRYDLAAFAALTLAVLSGLVDEEAAFAGFGHPATVIVAMVLNSQSRFGKFWSSGSDSPFCNSW